MQCDKLSNKGYISASELQNLEEGHRQIGKGKEKQHSLSGCLKRKPGLGRNWKPGDGGRRKYIIQRVTHRAAGKWREGKEKRNKNNDNNKKKNLTGERY